MGQFVQKRIKLSFDLCAAGWKQKTNEQFLTALIAACEEAVKRKEPEMTNEYYLEIVKLCHEMEKPLPKGLRDKVDSAEFEKFYAPRVQQEAAERKGREAAKSSSRKRDHSSSKEEESPKRPRSGGQRAPPSPLKEVK